MWFHAKKLLKTLKFWKSLNSLCKSGSQPQKSPKITQKTDHSIAIYTNFWIGMVYFGYHLLNPHVQAVQNMCAKGGRVMGSQSWPSFQEKNFFLRCWTLLNLCQTLYWWSLKKTMESIPSNSSGVRISPLLLPFASQSFPSKQLPTKSQQGACTFITGGQMSWKKSKLNMMILMYLFDVWTSAPIYLKLEGVFVAIHF